VFQIKLKMINIFNLRNISFYNEIIIIFGTIILGHVNPDICIKLIDTDKNVNESSDRQTNSLMDIL